MWNVYFLLSSFTVFLLFKNDWKKLAILFLLSMPFFGFIINTIRVYTNLAPLFYDVIFLIPLYFLFIIKNNNKTGVLPRELKGIIFLFVLIVFLHFINPFNPLPIVGRFIGIKVWLFYIPFIFIGYYCFEKISDILSFCKIFSIIAILPCIISILQYILSIILGQEVVMNFFYSPDIAEAATQNYARFNLTPTLTILRTPSTFTFPTQFGNYLLCALIPVFVTIYSSKNSKQKNFFKFILILIILASMASGLRGMYLYIPLFFLLFFIQRKNIISFLVIICLFIVIFYNFSSNFNLVIKYIFDLSSGYFFFFFEGFNINNFKDIIGHGVGTSTGAVRYVVDQSLIQASGLNESYYSKILYELGFIGLFVLIMFYILSYRIINECSKKYNNNDILIFIQSFKALLLTIIIAGTKGYYFNLFPIDFFIYFILGIIIKLNTINKDEKIY